MMRTIITSGLVTTFTVSRVALAPPAMAEERTCRGAGGQNTVGGNKED